LSLKALTPPVNLKVATWRSCIAAGSIGTSSSSRSRVSQKAEPL
jgi:hypothetical protein